MLCAFCGDQTPIPMKEEDAAQMSDQRQFTPLEKKIIHELQQDLPVVRRPFAAVAERVGISEAELLDKVREFIADDIIRRFGATLRHQRTGFDANAMVVWEVEPERAEEVGNIFASFREVSHCYQRPAMPDWPYRLFTMIHGSSSEVCRQIAQRMSDAAGVEKFDLLFTQEELKKTTMGPRLWNHSELRSTCRGERNHLSGARLSQGRPRLRPAQ